MSQEAIEILEEIRDVLRVDKPRIKFLTRKDVRKLLGYSEATVGVLFRRKDFPSINLGKSYVVEENAFIEWCKEKRV
jgi:hypothetical protein